uniref:Uncharacterized protein n=1 Tax=Fundulus heteroclitus TaxID=8078 RepID=A0A146UKV7_FUNHE
MSVVTAGNTKPLPEENKPDADNQVVEPSKEIQKPRVSSSIEEKTNMMGVNEFIDPSESISKFLEKYVDIELVRKANRRPTEQISPVELPKKRMKLGGEIDMQMQELMKNEQCINTSGINKDNDQSLKESTVNEETSVLTKNEPVEESENDSAVLTSPVAETHNAQVKLEPMVDGKIIICIDS